MNILDIVIQQIEDQYEWLLRVIIACALGSAIGFERKNRNKTAGIRTHAIVALGSALMMIVSKYGFTDVASYDASRVAAQVVSGVGFLGAGIIFVKDNTFVSGLTTAAGVWTTAGVGLCAGAGLYFIAICSAVILVLLQEVMHRVSFFSQESFRANVKLTMDNCTSMQELTEFISQMQVSIASFKISRSDNVDTKLELELVFPSNCDKMDFMDRLADYHGVISVKG